jgi:hypothetical protein
VVVFKVYCGQAGVQAVVQAEQSSESQCFQDYIGYVLEVLFTLTTQNSRVLI